MKELVEVIAKSLVDYPDEVVVTETENEKAIVLELSPGFSNHSDLEHGRQLHLRFQDLLQKRVSYQQWVYSADLAK